MATLKEVWNRMNEGIPDPSKMSQDESVDYNNQRLIEAGFDPEELLELTDALSTFIVDTELPRMIAAALQGGPQMGCRYSAMLGIFLGVELGARYVRENVSELNDLTSPNDSAS